MDELFRIIIQIASNMPLYVIVPLIIFILVPIYILKKSSIDNALKEIWGQQRIIWTSFLGCLALSLLLHHFMGNASVFSVIQPILNELYPSPTPISVSIPSPMLTPISVTVPALTPTPITTLAPTSPSTPLPTPAPTSTLIPSPTSIPSASEHVQSIVPVISRVFPSRYSTQFSNGSKGKIHDPSQLRMLLDDDWSTNYSWVIWKSEYTDSIPEFTFTFNNASIHGIKIRNGDLRSEKDYYQSARLKTVFITVTCNDGQQFTEPFTLSDYYTTEYQDITFNTTHHNVSTIDILYQGAYKGTKKENTCYISDIEFWY